ncbi:hypothetical protein ACHAXT_006978 [Thalassiosira profunda]
MVSGRDCSTDNFCCRIDASMDASRASSSLSFSSSPAVGTSPAGPAWGAMLWAVAVELTDGRKKADAASKPKPQQPGPSLLLGASPSPVSSLASPTLTASTSFFTVVESLKR